MSWDVRRWRSAQEVRSGSAASAMKKVERNPLMMASVSLQTASFPRTYVSAQPARMNDLMPAMAHKPTETTKMTSTTTCTSMINDQKQSCVSWYCFMHSEQPSKHKLNRSLNVFGR